ncbi:YeaC family protein [Congregibacter sp.]|uniref:YeaC family protein n=1 Tax=Congregibacter sp. TaxID=2744308 RepID=UPI003F6CB349
MDYQSLIDTLTPDVIARLRQGIETGRWPDGRPVTPEQREHSLQAVIAWEQQHIPEAERVGYIDKGRKAAEANKSDKDKEQQLRWVSQSEDDDQ